MPVNRSAQHAKNKDDWETPRSVFDEIEAAFGHPFELDVAASSKNALCSKFYTKEDDALVRPWTDWWWCNPPFSLKEEFLTKAWEELYSDHQGLMLLPSSQEAEWFRKHITHPKLKRVTWPSRVQFLIDGQRQLRLDKKTGLWVPSGNVGGSVIVAFVHNSYGIPLPEGLAGEPWVS